MSKDKDLLDPENNDLIPREPDIKDLMKSDLFPREDDCPWAGLPAELRNSELLPRDGFPEPPNDLCPGYVEPSKRVMRMGGQDLMSILEDAAEGRGGGCNRVQVDLGGGITASSCPGGGLSIFKDGVQVHSVDGLSAEDQKIVNDYRERNKLIPPE